MTAHHAGLARTVAAIVARPSLWSTAIRQAAALVPTTWRFPGNPLPDPLYLGFRAITQYGAADHAMEPRDVVSYLSWCRAWHRSVAARR